MKITITGGAGFLGSLLARQLLARGAFAAGGAPEEPIERLTLVDLVAPPALLAADPRVASVTGSLGEVVAALDDADVVFHLAAVVSSAAEADFDLGMRDNVDATRALLERCRRMSGRPIVVFSSSLAVFGDDPHATPLGVVDDDTLPRPQSSYGIQKFVGEQFVADYSRKSFVRGRTVRLMTVAVRPGRPNAAASSFVSGIIREPLAGIRSTCPVPADTPLAISSPRKTVEGLLRAAGASDDDWGSTSAMNLPALTTSPRAMAAALDAVAGEGTSALIDWSNDPAVEAIVTSWPARFATARAGRLGLEPEASIDDIVRAYQADLVL
jgi:nucleoside-diphosphate-sugar epimerase